MKRFFPILIVLALLVATAAGDPPYRQYIERYAGTAVSEMKRTGVPASISLAQGLLESNAGQSRLAREANNHFGVKCHNDWTGDTLVHDDDKKGECFRAYPDASMSYRDHSDFLRYRNRYKSLFELDPLDYKSWARGLKKAGYATDARYAEKLIKIIEEYDLYVYDRRDSIPETPLSLEKEVEVSPSVAMDAMEEFGISFPGE